MCGCVPPAEPSEPCAVAGGREPAAGLGVVLNASRKATTLTKELSGLRACVGGWFRNDAREASEASRWAEDESCLTDEYAKRPGKGSVQ